MKHISQSAIKAPLKEMGLLISPICC